MNKIAAMGETYYQSLILHHNAGPLGTAASLHAALAIPNVTLLEAAWSNHEAEMDVTGGTPAWPYLEIVDGYALSLDRPGLGIGPTFRWSMRNWRNPSRLYPRCRSHVCVGRLNALDRSVRDF